MAVQLTPLAPRDAIRAFEARGIRVPSFAWQEVYADQHASMFTVAKSTGFEILDDIYFGLQSALAEGKTYRQFASEITPLLQAKGWWGRQSVTDPNTGLPALAQLGSPRRLKLIFDANMRTSYAAGHWASFERNKKARPFLRYVHLEGQEHPRLHHQAWHNTVLPVDHAWWRTHAAPNGWGCHCTIQSLSQRDVDRLIAQGERLTFKAPEGNHRLWTNKITGEERAIPEGIDPGWDHNPGLAGAQAVANRAFAQKLIGSTDPIIDAALYERLRSEAFERFVQRPQGLMPVMALDQELASAIGLDGRLVILSEQTMLKQLAEHPELSLLDYQLLAEVGRTPTLVFRDGGRTLILVREADGRWRQIVVKSTQTGKAAFVSSYRFTSEADLERLLRKPGTEVLLDNRGL